MIRGMVVCLDDKFWTFRDNIVAIPLEKQILVRLKFYIAIPNQHCIANIINRMVRTSSSWRTSVVLSIFVAITCQQGEVTLDNVILLFEDGALCLMSVIRHGDEMKALEQTTKRRSEHNEDIVQRKKKTRAVVGFGILGGVAMKIDFTCTEVD